MINDENWNVPDARVAARDGHRYLARMLEADWTNIGELDQRIAEWKDNLAGIGLDLDDLDTCWHVAIVAERIFGMILADAEDCGSIQDVTDHVVYGMAPMILAVNSALETHECIAE